MCSSHFHRGATLFGLPLSPGRHSCMAGDLPIRRRDLLSMAGAAAAYACASPAFALAKLYGSVATYGFVKGSQQTVCSPDGSLDVRFQFIDRGRGPTLHSTISLDNAGFISKLRTTGYNYMKVM